MSDQQYFEKTAEIQDKAASFYDDLYQEYQVSYTLYKVRLSKEIRSLRRAFPGDILEVGCGTGYILRLPKSLGIPERHIYGLDISKEMVKKAEERLIS